MTKKEVSQLTKKFGTRTSEIVLAKANNRKKRLDVLREKYGSASVAAVLANLTRGTYDQYMSPAVNRATWWF